MRTATDLLLALPLLLAACTTRAPEPELDLSTKPWHVSAGWHADDYSSTAYPQVSWEIVQQLHCGMSAARAKELLGDLQSYHHPVKELTPIGMWEGDAMTLRLPLKDLKTMGGDCLVALLQVENAGPILGAAQYDRL